MILYILSMYYIYTFYNYFTLLSLYCILLSYIFVVSIFDKRVTMNANSLYFNVSGHFIFLLNEK